MLEIITLSIILSIDALFFGISLGINNIKLPKRSLFSMTITGLVIVLGAVELGDMLYTILPSAKIFGGILLIGIGIFLASDTKNKNSIKTMLDNPKTTDINNNGVIEVQEAIAISLALSIDSFAVVTGTAYLGYFFPFVIMLMQFVFLILGNILGKKIKPNIKGKYIAIISGVIIIIIGFKQLI